MHLLYSGSAFSYVSKAIGLGELRPIYTTENFWHGSDKNGTRTKKYSTGTMPC